mmetsp:Transcript_63735/g.201578  ORF Transcript_63735/g.201578 Transcript_63735/m.201578 type:complete len:480 (+) Transcript_63735:367-1806(+)
MQVVRLVAHLEDLHVGKHRQRRHLPDLLPRGRLQLVVSEEQLLGVERVADHHRVARHRMLEGLEGLVVAVLLAALRLEPLLRGLHLALRVRLEGEVLGVEAVHVAVVEPEDGVESRVRHGGHGPPHRHVHGVVGALDRSALLPARGGVPPVLLLEQASLALLLDLGAQKVLADAGVAVAAAIAVFGEVRALAHEPGGQLGEEVSHDLGEDLLVREVGPVPVRERHAPVPAKGAVRHLQGQLELLEVRPMPPGEGLLAVHAVVVRPPVVPRQAEELARLGHAVLVLHDLEHRPRPPLLVLSGHLADLPADHNLRARLEGRDEPRRLPVVADLLDLLLLLREHLLELGLCGGDLGRARLSVVSLRLGSCRSGCGIRLLLGSGLRLRLGSCSHGCGCLRLGSCSCGLCLCLLGFCSSGLSFYLGLSSRIGPGLLRLRLGGSGSGSVLGALLHDRGNYRVDRAGARGLRGGGRRPAAHLPPSL